MDPPNVRRQCLDHLVEIRHRAGRQAADHLDYNLQVFDRLAVGHLDYNLRVFDRLAAGHLDYNLQVFDRQAADHLDYNLQVFESLAAGHLDYNLQVFDRLAVDCLAAGAYRALAADRVFVGPGLSVLRDRYNYLVSARGLDTYCRVVSDRWDVKGREFVAQPVALLPAHLSPESHGRRLLVILVLFEAPVG